MAKVAAFPLTALILVALIACQGPAGPAGADGGKGDTGAAGADGADGAQGPAGMDAPHPLASVIIDTQYFALPIEVDTAVSPPMNAPELTVDVSAGFTGGTAEGRTYKLGAVTNTARFPNFSFELEGSTLTLKVTDDTNVPTDAAASPILDIAIPVQAEDTNGAVATTNVLVRLNDEPDVTNASDAITLVVGLQDAPTMDGDDDDMDPDDYDGQTVSGGDITCVMLNSCSVMLMAGDTNRDDSYTWAFYNTDPDSIMVMSTDDGVMIKGLKKDADAAVGAQTAVYVWAVDEGRFPMADEKGAYREDTDDADNIDQTKFPAGARQINVRIDPPPTLGAGLTINGQTVTMPAQTIESDDTGRMLGKVFDSGNGSAAETITLTQDTDADIVAIGLATGDNDFTDGVVIQAVPQNLTASKRPFTFKLMEPAPAPAATNPNPQQYLDVTVDITVSND